MKTFYLGFFASLSVSTAACAQQATNVTRTAVSGTPSLMHRYHSWHPGSCESMSGVVKVVTKPKNGKLTTRVGKIAIHTSRAGPVRNCAGKIVNSFDVYYTSTRSFRGADEFELDVHFYGNNSRFLDSYRVNVN